MRENQKKPRSIIEFLNEIISCENWHCILIRNKIRLDMISEIPDDHLLFNYLKQANLENLSEIRERVFKLAVDQYVENKIKKFDSKPVLKQITNSSNPIFFLNYRVRNIL